MLSITGKMDTGSLRVCIGEDAQVYELRERFQRYFGKNLIVMKDGQRLSTTRNLKEENITHDSAIELIVNDRAEIIDSVLGSAESWNHSTAKNYSEYCKARTQMMIDAINLEDGYNSPVGIRTNPFLIDRLEKIHNQQGHSAMLLLKSSPLVRMI